MSRTGKLFARRMGFNERRMQAERKAKADAEATARRATDTLVIEDAEDLIAAWNYRQARQMPMLFSPSLTNSARAPDRQCKPGTSDNP